MWAWLRTTAATSRGENSGFSQLRSRSSLIPWNSPQSRRTCWPRCLTRYFDPVTVPAAPRNCSVAGPAIVSEVKVSPLSVSDGVNLRCLQTKTWLNAGPPRTGRT